MPGKEKRERMYKLHNDVYSNQSTSQKGCIIITHQTCSGKLDVAPIQEPWIHKGRVQGLHDTGRAIIFLAPCGNSKHCIYIRNHIKAIPLLEFCSRDLTQVMVTHTGRQQELTVTCVHLLHDMDDPPSIKEQ
jgi:hypothetical protein